MEPLLPNVEGCEIFDVRTNPRLAFVGRVLLGLRFGASKRLILGSSSHVGLRTEPAGLEGGSFLGGSVTLAPKEVGIVRTGGSGAAGWEGRGTGDEGAENRDDGEPWVILVTPRVGVAG